MDWGGDGGDLYLPLGVQQDSYMFLLGVFKITCAHGRMSDEQ